jgi:hypothetical protein
MLEVLRKIKNQEEENEETLKEVQKMKKAID